MNAPDVPADAPATQLHETPWFSGLQHPVQIGVYKRLSLSNRPRYSFFDGKFWLWNHATAELAARSVDRSLVQYAAWCGLASPHPAGYGPTATAPATQHEVAA